MAHSKSKTLFVGGLSIAIGEQELSEYFGAFSKVMKVVFLRDHATGKPRGFAFVTLKDSQTAAYVAQLKHNICGRRVECQLAAKKNEKGSNAIERMRRKLFITNVPPQLSERAFEDFFTQFGQIHNCYLIKNTEKNCNKGFGFVEFESSEVADYLLNKHHLLELGKFKLSVHPFKDTKAENGSIGQCLEEMVLEYQGHHGNEFLTASNRPSEGSNKKIYGFGDSSFHFNDQVPCLTTEQGSGSSEEENLYFHLSCQNKVSSGNVAGKRLVIYNPSQNTYSVQHVPKPSLDAIGNEGKLKFSLKGSTLRLERNQLSCSTSFFNSKEIFNRQGADLSQTWNCSKAGHRTPKTYFTSTNGFQSLNRYAEDLLW